MGVTSCLILGVVDPTTTENVSLWPKQKSVTFSGPPLAADTSIVSIAPLAETMTMSEVTWLRTGSVCVLPHCSTWGTTIIPGPLSPDISKMLIWTIIIPSLFTVVETWPALSRLHVQLTELWTKCHLCHDMFTNLHNKYKMLLHRIYFLL